MVINYKIFGDCNEVKHLYQNAKGNINKVAAPFKKYHNDFAYDVVAISRKEIHPNVYEYGIGLGFQLNKRDLIKKFCNALKMTEGFSVSIFKDYSTLEKWLDENLIIDIDLRPRSSVRDTGLILCNCEGTIDEGYINEVKASFYHVITDLPIYEVGDKIGQIKIGFTLKCDFCEVNEFADTKRGLNGHGSTNN